MMSTASCCRHPMHKCPRSVTGPVITSPALLLGPHRMTIADWFDVHVEITTVFEVRLYNYVMMFCLYFRSFLSSKGFYAVNCARFSSHTHGLMDETRSHKWHHFQLRHKMQQLKFNSDKGTTSYHQCLCNLCHFGRPHTIHNVRVHHLSQHWCRRGSFIWSPECNHG